MVEGSITLLTSLFLCLSPISIPNPNFGRKDSFAQFKDTVSARINVPCGVCAECVSSRQMSFVQRLQMEELVNHFFFCTLTYDNESLPKVSTSTGYDIRYADISDVTDMFKRLRKRKCFPRPFRYFGVTELGSKRGRPHFHILFMLPKYDGDTHNDCLNLESVLFKAVLSEWKTNVTDKFITFRGKVVRDWRHPVWRPNCQYVRKYVHGKLRSNFDLHYVNPVLSSGGVADVAFYVMKYMLKPSNRAVRLQQALKLNLPPDEFDSVWSLVRPRHFESEALGLGQVLLDLPSHEFDKRLHYVPHPVILEHVKKGLKLSLSQSDPFPQIYSPEDGKFHPLCRYYKNHPSLFGLSDFMDFYYKSATGRIDNVVIKDVDHQSQIDKRCDDFDKKVADVDFQQTAYELDDFYDVDGDFLFIDDIPIQERCNDLRFLENLNF